MMNNSIKDAALLLTQYERVGSVGIEEFKEYYIDEEIEFSIDMLGEYNEYLSNNRPDDYIYEDLNEMLYGMETMDVVRCVYFGEFNFLDDYYRFNGYGNLKSLTEHEIIEEMKNDSYFHEWLFENNDFIDDDEAQEVIKEANALIRQGY